MITKAEFLKKMEEEMKEVYENMNQLREKSMDVMLTEAELEEAYNNLYDAKDLLDFYAKQMKLDTTKADDGDAFTKKEWKWVREYMRDLMEYGVGNNAEIRRITNHSLKSKTGAIVGQGDEIRVTLVEESRRHRGISLRNWLEIDRAFWLKDHERELSDYERADTRRTYSRYDDDDSYYHDDRYYDEY